MTSKSGLVLKVMEQIFTSLGKYVKDQSGDEDSGESLNTSIGNFRIRDGIRISFLSFLNPEHPNFRLDS